MLVSLHISHYVLIDSLDISFPEGLVIITGQTGAGKSILLGALSLLAGGKADSACIRTGEESCVVEGVFRVKDLLETRDILDANDIEWEDGELTIRRVVHSSGRSRCFINDSPVTIQLLSEISSFLIDIHSQHRSRLLTEAGFQISALDFFAGTISLSGECRECWKSILATRKNLSETKEELKKLLDEKDYNDSQFKELESASLKDNELEELELEQKTLSNAEEIRGLLQASLNLVRPPEGDALAEISSALREIRRNLEHVSKFIPSIAGLCERVESARIELDDITDEMECAAERINVSDGRLSEVEDRLSCLYSLMRKHSCSNIAELIRVREKYSKALFESYGLENKVKDLESTLSKLSSRHLQICRELSGKRAEAALSMSREISGSLQFLELERAVFEVRLSPSAPGATGQDAVNFLFSANADAPSDISRCASGGEISRIMLSLKAMMARFVGMPTMIFDEIDSGVSGSAAAKMGSMICSMGRNMQVFAITHLPQVAAKGDAHYVVSKNYDPVSGLTTSGIRQVDGEERVQELARMLSSETVTPEAVANARSMMK